MCNCIEEVRKDLIERNNANYVRIELSTIATWVDDENGRSDRKENITGQAIEIGYNHTKRNGEIIKKSRKSFISHQFCPFCGTEY